MTTNQVVVPPDATADVIDYLRSELATLWSGATVGRRLPKHIPDWFVKVFDTGGGGLRDVVVDDLNLTVDVYATKYEDAKAIAQLVRGLLHALTGTTQGATTFYKVLDFSGPNDTPDPATDKARASFTSQLSVRANAI